MATLERVLLHRDQIIAIGLDSAEKNNPPGKFSAVFARARAEGLLTVAHAGEEGPADYVRDAFDLLHVSRIDHGNHALDAPRSSSASPASGLRSPFVRCRTCTCGWSTTSTATLCGR
jgi:adenosine deaminase